MSKNTKAEVPMDGYEQGFVQGLCYAMGELIRSHDEPTAAKHIFQDSGYTVDDLPRAKVDKYDLDVILKVVVDNDQI